MAKELIKKETQVANQPDFSIQALLSEAVKNNVSVDTMERLLTMRTQLKKEAAEEAYNGAMSDFQSDCPIIKKDRVVLNKDKSSERYRFAPIDSIIRQTKDLIKKHGFLYSINTKVEGLVVKAICKVTHRLGHSEISEFQVPIDPDAYMNQQQKFASALTFAKRYAFCNAFGILTGDEDNDAKSNDKKEVSEEEKVMNLIKNAKTVGYLVKLDETIQKTDKLTEKQKATYSKMIKEKANAIETK